MILTYLFEVSWLFFFQHMFNGIFSTKNKRVMHYVSMQTFLDFMIFTVGMSYMFIVYKSYRQNTFLINFTADEEAFVYWMNYQNNIVNENLILFVYCFILWSKAFLRLTLFPVVGELAATLRKVLYEMITFGLFYLA